MNLVEPSNKSWVYFKNAWKPVTFGALNYLIKHPLKGPSALYQRLRYPLLKKSVTKPFITPEGYKISSNQELLVWSQQFIEEVLFNKEFLSEYTSTSSATIVDVGANHGMFTAWLSSYNDTSFFHCFEPYKTYYEVGKENTKKLRVN